MSRPDYDQAAPPRFMEAWASSFKHTLWVHSWWTGVVVCLLAIKSTIPVTHAPDAYPQKSPEPPIEQETNAPADSSVLWAARETGKVIVLEPGQACPEGGIGLDSSLTVFKNSDPVEPDNPRFALKAARLYIMSAGQGDFLAFCGSDTRQATTAFVGNAVITSGPDVAFAGEI